MRSALWVMGSVLALAGCGGSDSDDGGGGGGTVTEQWAGFCTGTFTNDTPIVDAFDEPLFTARAGDEFLMSDFDDAIGSRAEFLYLTSAGPDAFELEPSADGSWPFTSNCASGAGVPYYGVFTEVSVFAEEELTTKICELSEGSVLPAGRNARGYALANLLGDAATYEVILGPFSTQCRDYARGYVRVPNTRLFGTMTYLVPIVGLIGPQ
jgi:hypothetical protein